MELKLYNTLTRTKEVFRPLDELSGRPPADWRVRMYVCGPTVYDRAHIGNARPVIVFDVLFRLLRHLYGADHVTYVRNITDVDDKINARAAERGISIGDLTKTTFEWFKQDVKALGCLEPTHEPRATEYIAQMIKMIEALIATKHAYPAEGHVLFDVSSKLDYGKLSNRSVDDMIAGARVEVAPYKKNPMDFVLWKPSSSELPGWESPWGRGRPGWHIECSAMGEALLGETFDIHGGGIDLVFPHHENEIAQSECVHGGAPLAKVWMHNGFVQMEGEKMAKSEGNVVTVKDLLDDSWDGRVLRFAMLRTHYRQPINWTRDALKQAALDLHTFAKWVPESPPRQEVLSADNPVVDALLDDLNTPKATAELFNLVHKLQGRGTSDLAMEQDYARLWVGLDLLGLSSVRTYDPNQMFGRMYGVDRQDKKINELITARAAARDAKNFAESDRIRDELAKMGVVLHDKKDGTTTWEVAR